MLETLLPNLKFTQLFLLIAFVAVWRYDWQQKRLIRILLFILGISLMIEIAALIFIVNNLNYAVLYSVNAILHNGLWLCILLNSFEKKKVMRITVVGFFIFGILNLLFFEGLTDFDKTTFVISALLYIVIFMYKSFCELKKENLNFFSSNDYLLLFSPIIFFIGISYSISFSKQVSEVQIVKGFAL